MKSEATGNRWSLLCSAVLVVLLLTVMPFFCRAEDPDEVIDGPFDGVTAVDEVFSPPGLTGDWGGFRTQLAKRGMEFSADVTNIFQSVMHGGYDETSRYVGSTELILDVDGEKLGLWPGLFLRVAAEGRYGRNVMKRAGTVSPVNNDALFPADPDHENDDVFALTEATVTQFLTPWFGIYGGLLNTTSGDANDFAGFARSNEHFLNLSFLTSPVALRLVPNVSLGLGIVLIPRPNIMGTLTFMNTEESAGENPFSTDDGTTLVTEWSLEHGLMDLPVRHVAAFVLGYDNDFFRLGDTPRLEFPPKGGDPNRRFSNKDESWLFYYNGQLAFWTHPQDEGRNCGIFVRFGYADDETNLFEWNLAGGVGGTGLLNHRPRDRFGIGVYHVSPSDKFPLPQIGFKEETGFEVFYSFELHPGVALTTDLQYIENGLSNGRLVKDSPDNTWIGGLRLRFVL